MSVQGTGTRQERAGELKRGNVTHTGMFSSISHREKSEMNSLSHWAVLGHPLLIRLF